MTPMELKNSSIVDLIIQYKHKARCIHSNHIPIYNELKKRLGSDLLYGLQLETFHMQHGEGDSAFNEECDKLIEKYTH